MGKYYVFTKIEAPARYIDSGGNVYYYTSYGIWCQQSVEPGLLEYWKSNIGLIEKSEKWMKLWGYNAFKNV